MSTRSRLQNANDSKSLWNFTLSPGWSKFDAHILRLAVMKYGCGSWRDIGKHFPLKNCNQLNLQTQRLFGQQALAEFNKVHIDPHNIRVINDKIEGFRKSRCLINTGNNLKIEERQRRRKNHIETHGIPKEIYDQITVPVVLDPPQQTRSVIDDIEKLREMYRCVYDIELRVKNLTENKGKKTGETQVKKKRKKVAKKEKKTAKQVRDEMNAAFEKKDKNKNVKKDIEMQEENANGNDMDGDIAMAMALSASMEAHNINTPIPEKKQKKSKGKSGSKKKKKSSKKKKGSKKKSRKRKTMDDSEAYTPKPQRKRVKTK